MTPSAPANVPLLEKKQSKAKADVMPAVRKEAGQGGRKPPSVIIKDYMLAQTGDQKMVDAAFQMIYQQVQNRTGRLIQFGNTVFWATQTGPGTVDLHIFREESPRLLIKRMQQAYQWFKKHGFRMVTATLTDGETLRLIQAAGLPANVTNTTANDGKKMVPAYRMTMEIK